MIQIEMSIIDCPICGMKNAALIRSEEELFDFKCMECSNSFVTIFNYEAQEEQIEWLKGQWI